MWTASPKLESNADHGFPLCVLAALVAMKFILIKILQRTLQEGNEAVRWDVRSTHQASGAGLRSKDLRRSPVPAWAG